MAVTAKELRAFLAVRRRVRGGARSLRLSATRRMRNLNNENSVLRKPCLVYPTWSDTHLYKLLFILHGDDVPVSFSWSPFPLCHPVRFWQLDVCVRGDGGATFPHPLKLAKWRQSTKMLFFRTKQLLSTKAKHPFTSPHLSPCISPLFVCLPFTYYSFVSRFPYFRVKVKGHILT